MPRKNVDITVPDLTGQLAVITGAAMVLASVSPAGSPAPGPR